MFDLIEKLRRKPDAEKRRITIGVSAGITFVIFLIWVFVTIHNISALGSNVDESADTPSPFAQIGSSFSKVFDSISNIINKADTVIPKNISTTTTILKIDASGAASQ